MLKNFINKVKNLVEQNKDNKSSHSENSNEELVQTDSIVNIEEESKENEELIKEVDEVVNIEELENQEEIIKDTIEVFEDEIAIDKEDEENKVEIISNISTIENEEVIELDIETESEIEKDAIKTSDEIEVYKDETKEVIEVSTEKEIQEDTIEEIIEEQLIEESELTEEELEYIKEIKIKRGQSIKAIDVYTKEPQIFKTHKECSKKLKLPLEYIKENLKYNHTDYYGDAIKYLSEELKLDDKEYKNYLDSNKTPSQVLNTLNNKIFTTKISEDKRDDILCSEKIEPVKMHYIFECIDCEYDDYFKKYKSIIKRGGKKKIELVDKKGEVIEIFKSLDDCANFLQKEKEEIVDMLKYKDTKVGRHEIRYSLRNI
ncbi:MAG: hypothetical protein ACRDD7_12485 [Peptostreptococcaceae bacterium]